MSSLAIALLAAGSSRRFGPADKLLAPLQGQPLCRHAARAARALPADAYWAVVADESGPVGRHLTAAGFTLLPNPDAARGQATSVACAARAALATGIQRLLILLADMPFVTTAHLAAIAEAGERHDAVMSRAGARRLPPACFSAAVLPALTTLSGDRGAGSVFETLERRAEIRMLESMARDIDTEADREAADMTGIDTNG